MNNVYTFSYFCKVSWKVLAWQLETEVGVGAGQAAEVRLGQQWFACEPPAGPAWLLLETAQGATLNSQS